MAVVRTEAAFGEPSKWCSRCRSFLTLDSFWNNKATADGLTKWCASCCKAYDADHPSRAKARYKRANKRKAPWGGHSKATAEKAVADFISGSDSPVEDLNTDYEKQLLEDYLEDD